MCGMRVGRVGKSSIPIFQRILIGADINMRTENMEKGPDVTVAEREG